MGEEDTIIGGPGIIVEIDETKMGRRKYNRGHRVEGIWVLGGVERTPDRKVFAVAVPDRSADTLLAAIRQHVLPGSVIHTDLWRGYARLEEYGYVHRTVNHAIAFRDPETGVHTNTIEGTWNGMKARIAPRNRTEGLVGGHLWEFIWRRKHHNNLWEGFTDALASIHYE